MFDRSPETSVSASMTRRTMPKPFTDKPTIPVTYLVIGGRIRKILGRYNWREDLLNQLLWKKFPCVEGTIPAKYILSELRASPHFVAGQG
ncbi:MAG: hypothetical protein PVG14_19755 [Anaerolineales bacterium]